MNVFLGVAEGAGQSELGVDVTGDGEDQVFLGAGELVLRGDDFNIVGGAGLEAVLREGQFALRELLALLGDADLFGCGVEVEEGLADVLIDAAFEVCDLIVDALDARGKLIGFAIAIAIEDCEVDLALDEAGGLDAADAAAEFSDVAVEAELWVVAGAIGALLLDEALALGGEGEIVGAGLEGRGEKRVG